MAQAFAKILVANRGEISVRIIRACREMGLRTVAVYADCDRTALNVRYADEAYPLGGDLPRDTYLRIDKLLDVARRSGADAVHPGYGFLAENPAFGRACQEAGLVFIGPSPDVIEQMGSKTAARVAALAAGVPVVPGTREPIGPDVPDDDVVRTAGEVGFPLLIKAVAGGGGKGMRTVADVASVPAALTAARSEAWSSFGHADVYLERLIVRPRHIEVQLLGDHHGTILPFVERECSIQRRHQKVVEESPSVAVGPALRQRLADAAVAVARHVGYTNAGTIEFLLDASGAFFFLEMNTRLQVEHPITELVTQTDLVHWQIRIARGEPLTLDPARLLTPSGHAIECRIYAEDPDHDFLPSPGRVSSLRAPAGPGIRRDDGGAAAGVDVPVYYDPLIAKLATWGEDRPMAIARMARALAEYDVRGIKTTIPFFAWLCANPDFLAGQFDTTFIDAALAARAGRPFLEVPEAAEHVAAMAAAIHTYETRATRLTSPAPASRWARAARLSGLR